MGVAVANITGMRTLVVSDFHLGARLRRDVLLRDAALEALLDALATVDRLVLLGDVVELLEGRPVEAMEVAEPVLRAIGGRLDRGAEVILVPGNHDGDLVGPWLEANGMSPALDAAIPHDATPVLAQVVAALGPERVRVRYPGVWLAEGVWATHGHYLDRHLLPEVAFGVARGLLGRLPRDGARPVDYESAGGPSLTRVEALLTRWLPRPPPPPLPRRRKPADRSARPRSPRKEKSRCRAGFGRPAAQRFCSRQGCLLGACCRASSHPRSRRPR